MLFLSPSIFFCFSVFIPILYLTLIASIIFYLVPTLGENHFSNSSALTNKSNFFLIKGSSFPPLFYNLLIILLLLISIASFYENSIWMGHILISSFSKKTFFLVLTIFAIYLQVFFSFSILSSREIYDFLIVNLNSTIWLYLLFLSNSLLSSFFIIEVLSALLFLLLVSSVFSSLTYYNNLDLNNHHFLSNVLPITFLKSIIFFFWVSLLASLNLFMFTLLLYVSLFSFDWFLLEHVFSYILASATTDFISLFGLTWYVLLFSVFTKCGLAPFFFWKPTFFKGLTFTSIFFYICVFYFSLFLFFINFISSSFFFIFNYYFNIFGIITFMGLFLVLFLVLEAFYIKTFLAVSSILNSLMIFLAMSASHVDYVNFFL
jgi:hypothetical protein